LVQEHAFGGARRSQVIVGRTSMQHSTAARLLEYPLVSVDQADAL
jgi:hypothetical protein